MNTTHTPSPWQRSGETAYQLTDDGTQNLWCAHVSGPRFSLDDAAKVAQKMVAAPDMYAVLKELAECSQYWSEYDVPLGIHDRIAAALAKAVTK